MELNYGLIINTWLKTNKHEAHGLHLKNKEIALNPLFLTKLGYQHIINLVILFSIHYSIIVLIFYALLCLDWGKHSD